MDERKIVSFCTHCRRPIYEGEPTIIGMHEHCYRELSKGKVEFRETGHDADILRRAGYGAGSEPAKAEMERNPFYIVCGGCGNPYRVVLAEKEWIRGECPWCGNSIKVVRYKNRLFEIVNEEWIEMEREPIWRVAG